MHLESSDHHRQRPPSSPPQPEPSPRPRHRTHDAPRPVRAFVPVLLFSVLAMAAACGSPPTSPESGARALLEVAPNRVEGSTGDTARFEARAVDGSGQPVSGYEIAWSTSDSSVATVDAEGLVTFGQTGSATVAATAVSSSGGSGLDGAQDTAVVVVGGGAAGGDSGSGGSSGSDDGSGSTDGSGSDGSSGSDDGSGSTDGSGSDDGSWQLDLNEPSGYSLLTEDGHGDDTGWSYHDDSGYYEMAHPADELDVEGRGADGVYRTHFPAGMADGYDAANGWTSTSGEAVEFYWAYTLRLSSNWKNNTNLTKHALWFWGGKIGGWLGLKTDGSDEDGPVYLMVRMKEPSTGWHTFEPTTRSDGYVTRGDWHRIEFQVVANTSNASKTFRVWLDGELILERLDYSAATEEGPHQGQFVSEMKYANTYGGGGQNVPHDQFIEIGHTYISGR